MFICEVILGYMFTITAWALIIWLGWIMMVVFIIMCFEWVELFHIWFSGSFVYDILFLYVYDWKESILDIFSPYMLYDWLVFFFDHLLDWILYRLFHDLNFLSSFFSSFILWDILRNWDFSGLLDFMLCSVVNEFWRELMDLLRRSIPILIGRSLPGLIYPGNLDNLTPSLPGFIMCFLIFLFFLVCCICYIAYQACLRALMYLSWYFWDFFNNNFF